LRGVPSSNLRRLSLSGRRFYKASRCCRSPFVRGARPNGQLNGSYRVRVHVAHATESHNMSRVCPGGLGQAPAMRICCRRTTHRAGLKSTSPAPLTVWRSAGMPESETVSREPQLGSTHFFQQNCIFQPTKYDAHAKFVTRDLLKNKVATKSASYSILYCITVHYRDLDK
jgi:hypothetical protein